MASAHKAITELARQFHRLSLVDGAVSPERVTGVLAYIEKHRPAHARLVLKAYARLIAATQARNRADIEHAGALSPEAVNQITASLSRRYNRPVTASVQPNPQLIAGLRVRIGDDIYESSVAGQLAELAASV